MTAAAAAATSSTSTGPRRRFSASSERRHPSLTWALTRITLRELVFSQVLGQVLGAAVLTVGLVLVAVGPWSFQGPDVQVAGGYAATSVWTGTIMTFVHGIVMAARTPTLLRSGLTRRTVLGVHALTGLFLGMWVTALAGVLTGADLLLAGHTTVLRGLGSPYPAIVATGCGLLAYLLGGSVALVFLRRSWWIGVIELLVALNALAWCLGPAVSLWGTGTGLVWLTVSVLLVLAAGPLALWLQLRRFQPRR